MKKISVDIFDTTSLAHAVIELTKFKDHVEESSRELCRTLAEDYALKTVAVDYGYTEGGSIVCTAEAIPGGYSVKAEGRGVYFVEYGTGDSAMSGAILGTPPVAAYPGSYSAEHAQTYQKWATGGYQGDYKYERAPRSGMYFAFKAARDNVKNVAEEVFRK